MVVVCCCCQFKKKPKFNTKHSVTRNKKVNSPNCPKTVNHHYRNAHTDHYFYIFTLIPYVQKVPKWKTPFSTLFRIFYSLRLVDIWICCCVRIFLIILCSVVLYVWRFLRLRIGSMCGFVQINFLNAFWNPFFIFFALWAVNVLAYRQAVGPVYTNIFLVVFRW